METLLAASKIDYQKVGKIIHRISATELSKMSEPCYYPPTKKYYIEMLHYCGLTEKDTRAFTKRYWAGKSGITRIHKDPPRMFYVWLMHLFLKEKKYKGYYPGLVLFHGIREYSNLLYRQFPKYCNDHVFVYALEHLAKTHLFSREKTIANAVIYLSREEQKRWTAAIQNMETDKEGISKFIQEYRGRISQSIKSFAEIYYKADKEGVGIKTEVEPDEENAYQVATQDKTTRIIDDTVKKITVYKELDAKALNEAKKLTKVSASLAAILANSVRDIRYSDNIRICLSLFIKGLTSKSQLCGSGYITYVKKLMGIKRTKEKVYFKQQNNEFLMIILKDIDMMDDYGKRTNQSKFAVNSFLAYYLTSVLRHSVC
ncbi:hypothetical protein KAR91_06600 [Candidatus Pacearchaeota archaeon]|nr:hypothetical protein [Candidatus Pacearchaeota archaeon]